MSDDIEGCWAAREDLVACAPLTRALDEIERLRAALREIVDNSGSQSIEAQTKIAREALDE